MALAGFRKREGGKNRRKQPGPAGPKDLPVLQGDHPGGQPILPVLRKKQVAVYTNTFYRNGRDESVFIQSINAWFAANRSAANIKAAFRFRKQLGLVALKEALDEFAIQYELLDGTNKYQYALYPLHKLQLGLPFVRNASAKDILDAWKQNNPWAIVVDAQGVTHSRGDAFGLMLDRGTTSRKQWYILYKFDPAEIPK